MLEKDWIFIGAVGDDGARLHSSSRFLSDAERKRLLLPQPFLRPHILIDGTGGKWSVRRDDCEGSQTLEPAVGLLACHLLANPGWQPVEELTKWYALRVAQRPNRESTTATLRVQVTKVRRALSFDGRFPETYVETRSKVGDLRSAYRLLHRAGQPIVAIFSVEHEETVGVSGLDWDAEPQGAPLGSSVADDLKITLGTHERHMREGKYWTLELEACSDGAQSFAVLSLTLGLYVDEPGVSQAQCYTPHVRFTGPNDDLESHQGVTLSPMRSVSFWGYPAETELTKLVGDKEAKMKLAVELEKETVFASVPAKLRQLVRDLARGSDWDSES